METHRGDGELASDGEMNSSAARRRSLEPWPAEMTDPVLFNDQYGHGYANVLVGDHRETLRLRSAPFRRWLIRLCASRGHRISCPGSASRSMS